MAANLVVGLFGLTALFISLATVSSMISFGALAAFSFVNLVGGQDLHRRRGRRTGADIFKYGVLPFLGMAFTLYLWTQLSGLTFEIGLGWLAAGFVALLVITRGFRREPPPMYTGDEEELEPASRAQTSLTSASCASPGAEGVASGQEQRIATTTPASRSAATSCPWMPRATGRPSMRHHWSP